MIHSLWYSSSFWFLTAKTRFICEAILSNNKKVEEKSHYIISIL